ncbi:hypothetical protein HMPREF9130_0353 [Peptoniphilus sp. oral taxon 375 str. F0436]|nr:hypothetical protein HMPREF9130_0353 [Peptoniphilus sp. oral taxon 375 str. F0436]
MVTLSKKEFPSKACDPMCSTATPSISFGITTFLSLPKYFVIVCSSLSKVKFACFVVSSLLEAVWAVYTPPCMSVFAITLFVSKREVVSNPIAKYFFFTLVLLSFLILGIIYLFLLYVFIFVIYNKTLINLCKILPYPAIVQKNPSIRLFGFWGSLYSII